MRISIVCKNIDIIGLSIQLSTILYNPSGIVGIYGSARHRVEICGESNDLTVINSTDHMACLLKSAESTFCAFGAV